MNTVEARFHLQALKIELPRVDFPVSCKCTEEQRREFRGKVMQALEIAISALGNLEVPEKSVPHGS